MSDHDYSLEKLEAWALGRWLDFVVSAVRDRGQEQLIRAVYHRIGRERGTHSGLEESFLLEGCPACTQKENELVQRALSQRGAGLPELYWAPYKEFGIPDPAAERLEAPRGPVTIGSVGYQGRKIVIYWEKSGDNSA